jgi:hypothetical protein
MPREPEPVFKADRRSLIEPEQIAGIPTETVVSQIAVEPVGELNVRAVEWKPQRGRQVEHPEIWLREHQRAFVVIRVRDR